MNRRITIFIFAILAVLSGTSWAADSTLATREKDLYEKLLDISALTRSGVSYQDYSKQLPELIVAFDRFERSGGVSYNLSAAKEDFLRAKDDWERLIERRTKRTPATSSSSAIVELEQQLEQTAEEKLQINWKYADKELKAYAEEKAGEEAKKGGGSKADAKYKKSKKTG